MKITLNIKATLETTGTRDGNLVSIEELDYGNVYIYQEQLYMLTDEDQHTLNLGTGEIESCCDEMVWPMRVTWTN